MGAELSLSSIHSTGGADTGRSLFYYFYERSSLLMEAAEKYESCRFGDAILRGGGWDIIFVSWVR